MDNKKINVSVLGATGYAGIELVRLLFNHENVENIAVSSVSSEGTNLNDMYKTLIGKEKFFLINQDEAIEKGDVIFSALPHGLSEEIAEKVIAKNKILIDIGADFRLTDEEDYKKYYGLEYKFKDLHKESIYGLPEFNREKIKDKKIIGNPGCYPTSIALGLYPLLSNGFVDTNCIICDSKSGVTGAGKGLSDTTHFPMCNENLSPYKIANHRHIPEIEETLSHFAGEKVKVTFVPTLLPVNRGILSTIYCDKKGDETLEEIHLKVKNFYKDEYFVDVLNLGDVANLKDVKYSNHCQISLHEDKRTNKLIVVSVIDNMVKGAAGQAIQNMNIVFGFDEKTGLELIAPAF